MEKTDVAMFSTAVKSSEVQNQRENQVVKFGDKLKCIELEKGHNIGNSHVPHKTTKGNLKKDHITWLVLLFVSFYKI